MLNGKSDVVYSCLKSISNLVKTVLELCGPQTLVLMCYEERDIGDKPELQKRFNQVSLLHKNTILNIVLMCIPYIRKYWRSLNLAICPKSGRNALLAEFKCGGFYIMSLHRYHCMQF